MKPNFIYQGIAHVFIVLFLYSGLTKIMDVNAFRDQLASSPLLEGIAGLVTWVLPIVEILMVVILFIPRTRVVGLYASLILMFLFTMYLLVIQHLDDRLSCSCGGIIEALSPTQHMVFNLLCIGLGAIGIYAKGHNTISIRRRWIATFLSAFLLLVVSWMVAAAASTAPVARTGKEGRMIPSFSLLLADSMTHLSTKEIPDGKPFIVVGFSPYCPHCQGEIQDIIHHIGQFKETHFYLVTSFPVSDVKKFYNRFQLDKYPNITVGSDSTNTFLSYFNWHKIPYTAIYDGKKRLAQTIAGRANIASILRCIKS
jgi:hypothetical protein